MSDPRPERQSAEAPAQKVRVFRLLGKFWTIANALSLARLILVVPITYLVLQDGPLVWLMGLIVLAAVTDFFDGRLARWSHTVSDWGKVLDPLADKVAAAMITMALVFREPEPNLPLWLLVLLLARDATIVAGGVLLARRRGQVVMSIWVGKLAVTMLALTVVAALLHADQPVLDACVWITAALLVYSYLRYLWRFIRLMRGEALPQVDTLGEQPEDPSSSTPSLPKEAVRDA